MAQRYAFSRPSVVGLKFLLRDSSDITSSCRSNRTLKVDPRHNVAPSQDRWRLVTVVRAHRIRFFVEVWWTLLLPL